MRKIVSILMVSIMVAGIPMSAFANTRGDTIKINEDNINVRATETWTAWQEKSKANSTNTFEDFTQAAVLAALVGGLSTVKAGATALVGWITTEKPATLYYTTITYIRFSSTNKQQTYQVRYIYSDKKKTKEVGKITTETKESIRVTRTSE